MKVSFFKKISKFVTIKKIIFFLCLWICGLFVINTAIKKELLYDKYTLKDKYKYKNEIRLFQWNKMTQYLDKVDSLNNTSNTFAVLDNYKNKNGMAGLVDNAPKDGYGSFTDKYNVERNQAIPLFEDSTDDIPYRYARDGSLIVIIVDAPFRSQCYVAAIDSIYWIENKYINKIGNDIFQKVVFVDIVNQNTTTVEKKDSVWVVRSMNPVTTGADKPPYKRTTPPGIYVVVGKTMKMLYTEDGTTKIAGYAPFATRFSGGAYLHGIPINYPENSMIEYSWSLGTVPRSHRCVRNATSHAKYIYQWADMYRTLVVVYS